MPKDTVYVGATLVRRNAMARTSVLLFWLSLICLASLLVNLNACGGGTTSGTNNPPPGLKIQHIVVIFQENRTPDNLFQDPNLIAKGADIQNFGINSLGQKILLTPFSLVTDFDHSHKHDA